MGFFLKISAKAVFSVHLFFPLMGNFALTGEKGSKRWDPNLLQTSLEHKLVWCCGQDAAFQAGGSLQGPDCNLQFFRGGSSAALEVICLVQMMFWWDFASSAPGSPCA